MATSNSLVIFRNIFHAQQKKDVHKALEQHDGE